MKKPSYFLRLTLRVGWLERASDSFAGGMDYLEREVSKMKAQRFLANQLKVTPLLLTLCLTAQAQQPKPTPVHQSADDARIGT
jgi:hypothetical protein